MCDMHAQLDMLELMGSEFHDCHLVGSLLLDVRVCIKFVPLKPEQKSVCLLLLEAKQRRMKVGASRSIEMSNRGKKRTKGQKNACLPTYKKGRHCVWRKEAQN